MLLKRSIKKITLSLFALTLLFLMYLIPNSKNSNYDYIIEYVNKDIKTHDIYLLDSNNNLSKTEIIVQSYEKESLAKEIINDLIISSPNEDKLPNGFKAFINPNTTINKIEVLNDVIKIDFNSSLLDTKYELEEKVIEAIVYNLTSIADIKKVLIYIEGNLLTFLPQNKIKLPTTLTRDFGINKEYHLTSNKNISKTTIYYISKFNDNIVYTPVTKINNKTDDKIKIIVDELKDNVTNNLSSYLNYNTKLVNYEISNNDLILNFNDAILVDKDNYDIANEVINTLDLSIHDNYQINDIFIEVNGTKIYKNKDKVLNN